MILLNLSRYPVALAAAALAFAVGASAEDAPRVLREGAATITLAQAVTTPLNVTVNNPVSNPVNIPVKPDEAPDYDDPHALVQQAEATDDDREAVPLLLRATDGFIRRKLSLSAQRVLERLQLMPMSPQQTHTMILYQAHLAQLLEQHQRVLELLNYLEESPPLTPKNAAHLLLLRADSEYASGRLDAAITALIWRDQLPNIHPRARAQQQRRILNWVGELDSLAKSLMREHPRDPAIDGWIALAEALQSRTAAARSAALQQWRAHYPEHPAEYQLFNDDLWRAGKPFRPTRIAMLLPMTSQFGTAARVFYEGFLAARAADVNAPDATVTVYDIGKDPLLVSLYAQAAVNDGADFIVGPLGLRAVDAFLADAPAKVKLPPTLVVGAIPSIRAAPNLFGISLSPEREARQTALRAYADGHRYAGIFRNNTRHSRRRADAFIAYWEALGGEVVDDNTVSADNAEQYPQLIQDVLGISDSARRHRLLRAQLGVDLQFTPRRRDDMDFLFLAANASQARLLVPQLRFFQAHDLALYATPDVFSGKPDPAVDADLETVIFGGMNWILNAAVMPVETEDEDADAKEVVATGLGNGDDGDSNSDGAEAEIELPTNKSQDQQTAPPRHRRALGPYDHDPLDRLYALGLASYQVMPALRILRADPSRRFIGNAVDMSIESDGNIFRHLTWAQFTDGLPQPLPATAALLPSQGANQSATPFSPVSPVSP